MKMISLEKRIQAREKKAGGNAFWRGLQNPTGNFAQTAEAENRGYGDAGGITKGKG